jgi:hypothetical protein
MQARDNRTAPPIGATKEKAGVDFVQSEEGRTLQDLYESIPPSPNAYCEAGMS